MMIGADNADDPNQTHNMTPQVINGQSGCDMVQYLNMIAIGNTTQYARCQFQELQAIDQCRGESRAIVCTFRKRHCKDHWS